MTRTATRVGIAGGVLVAASVLLGATPAYADVPLTQHLPTAACNAGTENAHSHVPETTGNGTPIFAHNAIPGPDNVLPCGHGG